MLYWPQMTSQPVKPSVCAQSIMHARFFASVSWSPDASFVTPPFWSPPDAVTQ